MVSLDALQACGTWLEIRDWIIDNAWDLREAADSLPVGSGSLLAARGDPLVRFHIDLRCWIMWVFLEGPSGLDFATLLAGTNIEVVRAIEVEGGYFLELGFLLDEWETIYFLQRLKAPEHQDTIKIRPSDPKDDIWSDDFYG